MTTFENMAERNAAIEKDDVHRRNTIAAATAEVGVRAAVTMPYGSGEDRDAAYMPGIPSVERVYSIA